MHMSVRNGFLVTAALGLLCTGCATNANRPTAEITRARTLIEQAEKAGAQQYAASDLDQARNKLRLANAAVEDGKNDEARARANEAAADAELAQARATSGEAKKAAAEVASGTATLQREADRNDAARTPGTTPSPTP
jgi:membrane-bound lytic murein transglycosylase